MGATLSTATGMQTGPKKNSANASRANASMMPPPSNGGPRMNVPSGSPRVNGPPAPPAPNSAPSAASPMMGGRKKRSGRSRRNRRKNKKTRRSN